MEMKPSLNLSLRPALIMTPRLQQALKLLQVPTLELQQILKQEIMQNPLLEEVDELTENEDLAREDTPEEAANQEAEDSIDGSEYMQDGAFDRCYIPQSETNLEFLEKIPVTRTTLAESLLEQLHYLNLPADRMVVAEFLIGSLDDSGWLSTPLEDVAQATGQPVEECEKVLLVIQALEPVGVGARNLREC